MDDKIDATADTLALVLEDWITEYRKKGNQPTGVGPTRHKNGKHQHGRIYYPSNSPEWQKKLKEARQLLCRLRRGRER